MSSIGKMTEPNQSTPEFKANYAIQKTPTSSRYTVLTRPVNSLDLAQKFSLPTTSLPQGPSPSTPQKAQNQSRPQTPIQYAKVVKSTTKQSPQPANPNPPSPQPKYIDNPNAEVIDQPLEPNQFEEKPSSTTTTYRSPILSEIFPPQFNYYPESPQKNRIFYEFILVDTDSVEITHIRDTKDQSRIAYSKAKILRVLTLQDWNQKIWTGKSFSQPFEPQAYNYDDYQTSWYNTFYVRAYDHSWFIHFAPHFQKTFPNWFLVWWKTFGAIPEIFPQEIKSNYDQFKRQCRTPPACLHFTNQFQIPWILSWWFAIRTQENIPYLHKKFKLKWWQNYKLAESPVQDTQPIPSPSKFPHLTISPNQFKTKKEYKQALKQALQDLSDSEEEEASVSCTPLNEDDCFGLNFI